MYFFFNQRFSSWKFIISFLCFFHIWRSSPWFIKSIIGQIHHHHIGFFIRGRIHCWSKQIVSLDLLLFCLLTLSTSTYFQLYRCPSNHFIFFFCSVDFTISRGFFFLLLRSCLLCYFHNIEKVWRHISPN